MKIHLTSCSSTIRPRHSSTPERSASEEARRPARRNRWLTVVSPQDPGGPELFLEPDSHPAVGPYVEALVADGILSTSFEVADVAAEVERLQALGVRFTQEALQMGPVVTAVFDDTCGNLMQIVARQ